MNNLKRTILIFSFGILLASAYLRFFVPTPTEKYCTDAGGIYKVELNTAFNRYNPQRHTYDSCEINGIKYAIEIPKGHHELYRLSQEDLDMIKKYEELNK